MKTIDKKAYLKIIEHYNNKINIYGLTTKGLDWKSKKDNNKRFLKIYNQIKFNYQKKVSIIRKNYFDLLQISLLIILL